MIKLRQVARQRKNRHVGMEEKMKLMTVVIPCYNSAAYMSHAVETLLTGGEDIEILIVNDGSSDETGQIADDYEQRYPSIIHAVHQENCGHGGAVNTGLKHASGIYFKVVDSDDWVSEKALLQVLERLRQLLADGKSPDLFLTNYVYEKLNEEKKKVINYKTALPQDIIFGWNDVMHFKQGHYILMHSCIYRTKLLRDCGLELPKHTFYVDNIFVYQPLPSVRTMYYMNVNLYRYFIGRDDQSVTEENMIKRIDQQLFVNKYMIDCCDVMALKQRKLKNYMIKYLGIIMTVSSVYLIKEGSEKSLEKKEELWNYLKTKNHRLYRCLNAKPLGWTMNLRTKFGHAIIKIGYVISKKIFKFG